MKRYVKVPIDCENKRCGECSLVEWSTKIKKLAPGYTITKIFRCLLFRKKLEYVQPGKRLIVLRCASCLKAEVK